jgi:hypothetical protein
MSTSPISGFEIPYKLLRRFEAVIESIFALNATIGQLGFVRFKPIFANYISCIESFKSSYPEEYKELGLDEITLFDEEGRERFTGRRLSTILHQAQAVVGMLKGFLPPNLIQSAGGTTVLVASQAAAQASATATAQLQFTLMMEGLDQAIQESQLDEPTKDELKKDIDELKNLPTPDESKIKALAIKLGKKLQEVGENVAIGVITNLLKSRMGQQ